MPLTPRQREVVALLREGLTAPEIAGRLGISTATVRRHIEAIANKVPGPQKPIRRILLHAEALLAAA